jgi:hypothetical protein
MRRSIDQILVLDRVKGLSLASQPAVLSQSRAPERVAASDVFLIWRGGRVFDTGCSISDPRRPRSAYVEMLATRESGEM